MASLGIVGDRLSVQGSVDVEFKSCVTSLSKDFWPTYSAFANTFGGTIVLGVDDKTHEAVGVRDPDKIIKEIWDLLNDPKKVSVNLLSPSSIEKEEVANKTIVIVEVPRAERRKRPVFVNGTMESGTYKRNGEGDYHCSIEELAQMLRDRSDIPQDSVCVEKATLEDLDGESISSFRSRMSNRVPSHPWNSRSDEDFLRLVGASSKGEDGNMHPTIAGLLMFGYDYSIMAELPNYHLDYYEFGRSDREWNHRISTGTGMFAGNVYNFLCEVSNRISIVNSAQKVLDGMERVDDTDSMKAQRELAVNALVHADYRGTRGIRIEWRPDSFTASNPGCLRVSMREMLEGGISDPRNPHLLLMTGLIGFSERAGSGVSGIVEACRRAGTSEPRYEERSDPESVTVRLDHGSGNDSESMQDAIKDLMVRDPSVSLDKISKALGKDRSKVMRIVNSMKADGIVERLGGTRGRWNVIVKRRPGFSIPMAWSMLLNDRQWKLYENQVRQPGIEPEV